MQKELQAIIKLKDEFSKPLKDVTKGLKDTQAQTKIASDTFGDYRKVLNSASKTAVAVGGTMMATLGGALASCAKEAIEFESAFTGVVKTLGDKATPKQMDEINKGLLDMSTKIPKSAKELANIAEIAGQLGIEVPNVLNFTETMARLSDSTNIAGEEGALALAKFMNVMGTSQADVDKLGSVIVALGNNMATTEADILSMATRLSDLGILANFSEPQVLGWASAMSSVGIEAEMGGTAMKKMVTEIERATISGGESLQQFASIAGVSADEYKKAFKKDASGATLMFLKGLDNVKKSGGSISKTLDDMGIKEVRLRETMIKLASANDDVAKALGLSNDEWQRNKALLEESQTRYGTTESSIQLMKNQIAAAKIEIGTAFLPIIRDCAQWLGKLAEKFNALDPETRKNIVRVIAVVAGISALLTIIGAFGLAITGCSAVFGVLAAVIAFVCTPIGALIAAMLLLTAGVVAVRDAWVSNWNGMQDKVKTVCNNVKEWWGNLKEWFLNTPIVATVTETWKKVTGGKGKGKDGKRSAFGTKRVVGNEIPYRLHDGEKILTRSEADRYEKNSGSAGGITINIDKMTVREEADIDKIAKEFTNRLNRQRLAFGGTY